MGYGVGEECAGEEVRDVVIPDHLGSIAIAAPLEGILACAEVDEAGEEQDGEGV